VTEIRTRRSAKREICCKLTTLPSSLRCASRAAVTIRDRDSRGCAGERGGLALQREHPDEVSADIAVARPELFLSLNMRRSSRVAFVAMPQCG